MERITPAETYRRILDARLTDLHTALPGRVRSYDAATQTADVEPMIKRGVPTGGEEDEVALEALPVLPSVPVLFPSGGQCFVTFPLAVGDPVLLVFSERDTSHYRATGAVADPGVPTMHGLSGAVAIPCAFGPRSAAMSGVSSTDLVVGRANGLANITVKAGTAEVGGASDSAALASRVAALETAISAHTHGGVTTGVGSTAVPTWVPPGNYGSARLKVGG
ncbi:hypothetical protein K0U83_17545 [bacterium]|nr:hypothetical protein [bacterium]